MQRRSGLVPAIRDTRRNCLCKFARQPRRRLHPLESERSSASLFPYAHAAPCPPASSQKALARKLSLPVRFPMKNTYKPLRESQLSRRQAQKEIFPSTFSLNPIL